MWCWWKPTDWRRPLTDRFCSLSKAYDWCRLPKTNNIWSPLIDERRPWLTEAQTDEGQRLIEFAHCLRPMTDVGQYVSKALTGEDRWQMNNRQRSLLTHALLKVIGNLDWWEPLTDDGGCWFDEGCPLTDDGGCWLIEGCPLIDDGGCWLLEGYPLTDDGGCWLIEG